MDTAKLNDWLTVVTNIGVILGLVLLAYEISQTNESLKQEATALAVSNTFSQAEMWDRFAGEIARNPELADLWMRGSAGEELSAVDQERYRSYTTMLFWAALNMRIVGRAINPDGPALLFGAGVIHRLMEGRPGLRTAFNEWAEESPRLAAVLTSDFDEIERLRGATP